MKKLLVLTIAMALVVFGAGLAFAGEWHTGTNNVCTDCHTMHFSQTHNWDSSNTPSPTSAANGNWLGASGPNPFLLKQPVNELCKSCHEGQSFAPDVVTLNTNAAPAEGRSAGALNELTSATPYEAWKGHTLGSTATPPGYDPTKVGLSATWYTGTTEGLECIHCHTQHGLAGVYRNLGPRNLGSANLPSYVIGTANSTTRDVWINISAPYNVNSGSAGTFNPFYASANVSYNRVDKTVGTTKTSNGIDTMCATCHGNFHGGTGDTEIGGGTPGALADGFIRHPTAQTVIGAATAGGHSSLTRYTAQPGFKAKVYANDRSTYTDASPGCVSCHKGHGNRNPFGLIFTSHPGNPGYSTSNPEEGNYDITQTYMQGYRNLCGQCHGQGNN